MQILMNETLLYRILGNIGGGGLNLADLAVFGKIRQIKFGGLAVLEQAAKLNLPTFSLCMQVN